ncbi:hypothetical protein [Lewinella sp. IMCC34191]|uniref:hypothetical protein n=1 Tax=Lewinella sp. IMCC34191 TaxID=2259172 RepID=UPI0013003540|nr:hypothetical protein [Lewinella sp. IMCC34191]
MDRDTIYLDYDGTPDSLRTKAVVRTKQLCFLAGGNECSDFADITYRRPAE